MRDDDQMTALLALDGRAGPALAIDDDRLSAIVAGALDRVYPPSGGGGGAGPGGSTWRLATLAAGFVAGAAVVVWIALSNDDRVPPAPPRPVQGPVAAPAPPPPTPEAEIEMPPLDRPAPRGKAPPPAKGERAAAATAEPAPSPEDLLAEANAARRRRAWKEAALLYDRVDADVARVASATIRLEHLGDPEGALARFRRAVGGDLAEEARYGIAEAHRALGDAAAEAAALDAFLRAHPRSPLADRARARRADLP